MNSSRTIVAQATRLWDDRYELRFPYNQEFIEALKTTIPPPHRKWDPARKAWIVGPGYTETAIHLLRAEFPDAIVTNPDHVTPPRSHRFRRTDPHQVLFVSLDAPRCVIDAAFKALSKELHPDRAPADKKDAMHEEQVALNRAYESLRARIGS